MINIAQAIALLCLVFSFHVSFAGSHEGDMEPEGATDYTHTTPSHTSSMMTSHHDGDDEDHHTEEDGHHNTTSESNSPQPEHGYTHGNALIEHDEMDNNNTDERHEDHTELHEDHTELHEDHTELHEDHTELHEDHTSHHDDYTEHADDHTGSGRHTMTSPYLENTTLRGDHSVTTPMPKQEDHKLLCHLCEGDECRNPTKTCVSETGACWVMYLMESIDVLRGCEPKDPDTICTDTDQLPFGGHFNQMVCEWCCQGDFCREENSMSLGALCNDLLVQSSAANSLSLLTKWITLATVTFLTTKDVY